MTNCWHLWRAKLRGGLCAACLLNKLDRDSAMRRHPAGKKRP